MTNLNAYADFPLDSFWVSIVWPLVLPVNAVNIFRVGDLSEGLGSSRAANPERLGKLRP